MCFKELSRVFQDSSLGAFSKFQGCFKKILRVCQGRFQCISMEFSLGFKGV